MIAMVYTEAYQITGNQDYKRIVYEIFHYVNRDMTSTGGGFFSAEDADSEGKEGKFYVWDMAEIEKLLEPEEAKLFNIVYSIEKDGNFKEEATLHTTGENILHLKRPLPFVANEQGISIDDLEKKLSAIRKKLFDVREERIHPYKDDKILTDWNGLMIASLAKAACVFDEPEFTAMAKKAVLFIEKHLLEKDGRLLHRFRDGQAGINAHLDDYAFLVWGLLELYEATFEVAHLQRALELITTQIADFWDTQNGGFYFTAETAEKLLIRQKELYDGAIPSGNSVSALNLIRLGRMLADSELEEKSYRIEKIFAQNVERFPAGFTQFLLAVDFSASSSYEVVFVGDFMDEATGNILRQFRAQYLPNTIVVFKGLHSDRYDVSRLIGYITDYSVLDNKTTVYVCENYTCQLPTNSPEKMLELLKVKQE